MLNPRRWALAKGWMEDRRAFASIGLAAVVLITGCETVDPHVREQEAAAAAAKARAEKEAEFNRILAAESRAWRTIAPMMREGATYHEGESFGYIGAAFAAERFYPDRFAGVARAASVGPYVSVSHVSSGSAAERAGLLPGDRVLAINGRKMPRWDRAARFAASKAKRLIKPDQVNTLVVRRNGEVYRVEVVAEKAACYAVVVSPDKFIDMRADGEVLWLSLDAVEQLTDPDELAYACAFILAQNIMRHPEKRRKNQWVGQVFDIAAQTGGITTSGVVGNLTGRLKHWAFTAEADLVSLYLLAAAGYDISKYPDFWRRQMTIAARSTRSGTLDPRDLERLEIINQVIESIERKRAHGSFLFPEEYLAGNTYEVQLEQIAGLSGGGR